MTALNLKMYREYAHWWPLLSPREDYEEEAQRFIQLLQTAGMPEQGSLLELGSGGGHSAFYLKTHFAQTTLVDLSAEMLKVSQALNPDCTHIEGNMLEIELNQHFDVVFIHDAIDYLLTPTQLQQCFHNAARHLKPNGLLLLVPDHLQDSFESSTVHGGVDQGERGMRYLEWTYDPDPQDQQCTTEYVYLFREGQEVQSVHEQHVFGLFSKETWLACLNQSGFETTCHQDAENRVIFLARKQ